MMVTVRCDKGLLNDLMAGRPNLSPVQSDPVDINILYSPDIKALSEKSRIYIINGDDFALRRLCAEICGQVIFCGMGKHCDVTASSIDQDGGHFTLCIKRPIMTLGGQVIEPQEVPLWPMRARDIERALLLAAADIVADREDASQKEQ